MFEISDFFDVSALSTVLEERLMSTHDVQLAINALRNLLMYAIRNGRTI